METMKSDSATATLENPTVHQFRVHRPHAPLTSAFGHDAYAVVRNLLRRHPVFDSFVLGAEYSHPYNRSRNTQG